MKTTTVKRRLALFVAIIMALTLWTALPLTASADNEITITGEAQVLIPGVPHEFELWAAGDSIDDGIQNVMPTVTITGPAETGDVTSDWTVKLGDLAGNWYTIEQLEAGFNLNDDYPAKIQVTAPENAALGVYTYSLQLTQEQTDLLNPAYTNTLTVLPAVGLDTVTLTAGDNEELAYAVENNEGGDVIFTAATSVEPGIGIVPGVTVALALRDGDDVVEDWTDFFDREQSAIQYGDFEPRSLTNLLSGPQDLYMGEAAITLVPKSNAAGHSFTYTVTVSKGDVAKIATGSLKVADAAITSLAAGSNTNLSVDSGGAVTFAATLDPADGIVTGVTVALNLTYNNEAVDWKTYFDAEQSTIQYGDFDPISLNILTSYAVDLYPSEAAITLVPKSAAAGRTFTYTVTVSKGESVTVVSNEGILTVAPRPSTPPVDEPTEPTEPDEPATVVVEPEKPVVDAGSGVAETAVTEDLLDKAIADAEAATEDSDKGTQIKIEVPEAEGDASGVAVSLPTAQLGKVADSEAVDELIITTEAGDFELDSTALANIVQSAGDEETVTLSITKEDAAAVPPADRPQMADAAIFEVEIRAGQTVIHEIGSVIKISLPYTLKNGETAANVRVYYLPDQGDPQKIDGATYDSAAAKVSFPTNHLSLWAVKADTESVPPATENGWVKQANGTWKYYADGTAKTGWFYDKDDYKAWFYFDKTTEVMKTGWVYDQNTWYYLASNGAMKTGWVKDSGSWYYLAGSGAMVAAKWFKDTDRSWYYLSGNGKMLTGKQNVGGKAYTFKANGVWVS
jgi:hypothetical protein